MAEEKGNIPWVQLYPIANEFKEKLEATFLPLIFPAEVMQVCISGEYIMYLLKNIAPNIWKTCFGYFVESPFTDDFEEYLRDRDWINSMKLWGHTIDYNTPQKLGT